MLQNLPNKFKPVIQKTIFMKKGPVSYWYLKARNSITGVFCLPCCDCNNSKTCEQKKNSQTCQSSTPFTHSFCLSILTRTPIIVALNGSFKITTLFLVNVKKSKQQQNSLALLLVLSFKNGSFAKLLSFLLCQFLWPEKI